MCVAQSYDFEQCINSRIKGIPSFRREKNEKSTWPVLYFSFARSLFPPRIWCSGDAEPVFSFTFHTKNVIPLARLILNEWTIEQMAFRYLNFKSKRVAEPWQEDKSVKIERAWWIWCQSQSFVYVGGLISITFRMSQRHFRANTSQAIEHYQASNTLAAVESFTSEISLTLCLHISFLPR